MTKKIFFFFFVSGAVRSTPKVLAVLAQFYFGVLAVLGPGTPKWDPEFLTPLGAHVLRA